MWTCPKCQALFVQKNSAHSCVKTTVAEFLKGKPKRGVELFKHLISEFKKIGPVKLHPVKTRIAIMVDVRFAAINRIGQDSIDGHFWLKEKIKSPKFFKIEQVGKSDFIHRFRLSDESQIDAEFRKHMKAAYAIGQRRHLKSNRS
jgi:hypothetical protein